MVQVRTLLTYGFDLRTRYQGILIRFLASFYKMVRLFGSKLQRKSSSFPYGGLKYNPG